MSAVSGTHDQQYPELVFLYALQALPASDVPAVGAHIATCAGCRQELETLRPLVESFAAWPTDVLRPAPSLWERLAQRIATETGQTPVSPTARAGPEPAWQEVVPGVSVKLLTSDEPRSRVSMLVRLAPGAAYPAHRHADIEELHLLQGTLMIADRTLHPGDYNRAAPGTVDHRVWSETGCTCVLITSSRDVLL
jgi:anti-sigma factor ChrR (cupin superfamily)